MNVFENFGFYEIVNIKTSTIVSVIKDIMIRYKLNLEACRGQCYYGASDGW